MRGWRALGKLLPFNVICYTFTFIYIESDLNIQKYRMFDVMISKLTKEEQLQKKGPNFKPTLKNK